MPKPVIARLAPTPSGYLHLGNAVNFILTWLSTRQKNGTLHLRIDDLDHHRCRREFVDDIFSTLDWLGIEPDAGPSGSDTFYRSYSQVHCYDSYREALRQLDTASTVPYACNCSRKSLGNLSRYPGICRDKALVSVPGETAWRLPISASTTVHFGPMLCKPEKTFGDVIVWRKDDIPAYQLVSILEDMRLQTNLIIRGMDLIDSSAVQVYLASLFGADSFLNARFHHHPLVLRKDGKKLSKSEHDYALRDLRSSLGDTTAKRLVIQQACAILGMDSRDIETTEALLMRYKASSRSLLHFAAASMQ